MNYKASNISKEQHITPIQQALHLVTTKAKPNDFYPLHLKFIIQWVHVSSLHKQICTHVTWGEIRFQVIRKRQQVVLSLEYFDETAYDSTIKAHDPASKGTSFLWVKDTSLKTWRSYFHQIQMFSATNFSYHQFPLTLLLISLWVTCAVVSKFNPKAESKNTIIGVGGVSNPSSLFTVNNTSYQIYYGSVFFFTASLNTIY